MELLWPVNSLVIDSPGVGVGVEKPKMPLKSTVITTVEGAVVDWSKFEKHRSHGKSQMQRPTRLSRIKLSSSMIAKGAVATCKPYCLPKAGSFEYDCRTRPWFSHWWIRTPARSTPPDYLFMVRTSNYSWNWSETGDSILIVIYSTHLQGGLQGSGLSFKTPSRFEVCSTKSIVHFAVVIQFFCMASLMAIITGARVVKFTANGAEGLIASIVIITSQILQWRSINRSWRNAQIKQPKQKRRLTYSEQYSPWMWILYGVCHNRRSCQQLLRAGSKID